MRIIVLLLILSFYSKSYTQDTVSTDNWKSYTKDNFAILYPGNWEINTANQPRVMFTLMAPMEDSTDRLSENVTLQIQSLNGQSMSFEQYAGLSKSQIVSQLKEGRVLSEEKKSSGKDEYYRLMYTGKMSDLHLVYLQHIRIKEGKLYVLTFTCEYSKVVRWEKAGEEVMQNFKLF